MLEFYYGTVNSAKTLTMLAKAHAWKSTGKSVCIVKPALDTRSCGVSSRAGLSAEASIILKTDESLSSYASILNSADVLLVDEVQFLSIPQIVELRKLSVGLLQNVTKEVSVQCYGLRTLSDGTLWESIAVLMAQADTLQEISTVCAFCSKRAVFSKSVQEGEAGIKLSWDGYIPVCAYHFLSDNSPLA